MIHKPQDIQGKLKFSSETELWHYYEKQSCCRDWSSIDHSIFLSNYPDIKEAIEPLTNIKEHVGYFSHFCEFFDALSQRWISYLATNHILSNFCSFKGYHDFCEQGYLFFIVERKYVKF